MKKLPTDFLHKLIAQVKRGVYKLEMNLVLEPDLIAGLPCWPVVKFRKTLLGLENRAVKASRNLNKKGQSMGASLPNVLYKPEHVYHIVRESVAMEREACAKIAEKCGAEFASDEYATGQPESSFGERFACKQIAEEIRKRNSD